MILQLHQMDSGIFGLLVIVSDIEMFTLRGIVDGCKIKRHIYMYDLNNLGREELMQLVLAAYTVMSNMGRVEGEIRKIENQMSVGREKIEKMPRYITFGAGVGWFFASVGIALIVYAMATLGKTIVTSMSEERALEIFIPVQILLILFILSFALTISISNIVAHRKYIKESRLYIEFEENAVLQRQQLIKEKNQLNMQYADVFPKLKVIPERYRNTNALFFILRYLTECRASNWKEAVNLYERQLKEAGIIRVW